MKENTYEHFNCMGIDFSYSIINMSYVHFMYICRHTLWCLLSKVNSNTCVCLCILIKMRHSTLLLIIKIILLRVIAETQIVFSANYLCYSGFSLHCDVDTNFLDATFAVSFVWSDFLLKNKVLLPSADFSEFST